MNSTLTYSQAESFLLRLFQKVNLPKDKALATTKILLEGELLGHRTHGLQLTMPYIEHIKSGSMEIEGTYDVLNSAASSKLWDGKYLTGPWLIQKGIKKADVMAKENGVGTVVIQKSSHIGCLAAYLEEATQNGNMVIIACSDPDNKTVAPFGGTTGVYSPNPLALGIPTETQPLIIDVSMSATSNGLIHQKNKTNEPLEHPWLITPDGEATTDAKTFFEDEPSTILPLGGLDSGYKGFALGIMIEAMTSALGGHGRSSEPGRWGASVFIQVINPKKFAGESYFKREMERLKEQSLASKAANADRPVRMPGERGLALKTKQMKSGLRLRNDTFEGLQKLSEEFGLKL
ncbi:Ldh family oxidoreductase [Arcticibacterium luteifluviistationis]|uniref:Lactate dehydrogenase n=1 Tax=Arcticibacterium luteifluviistationis TaxID=1784714 RepID=A0A2Z4GCM3_9BACT|nr:Ldh family oxidoreductase [Arcticibacterium luteifluviistationis]AWV98986.1 lactate dehydrogenase [Arcticibacterium luteifluviistationis]